MKRWAAAGLTILVLGASFYGSTRLYKLSHYGAWLNTVATGDDIPTVHSKMGLPDRTQKRPDPIWCDVKGCEFEFLYGQPLPPEWWAVGFDGNGRVVWTAKLDSP
jgi:hypothetical protein